VSLSYSHHCLAAGCLAAWPAAPPPRPLLPVKRPRPNQGRAEMLLLLPVLLLLLWPALAAADCGGSACVVASSCGAPRNSTRWRLAHQVIDGLVATNILLEVPVPGTGPGACASCSNVNCADKNACHIWCVYPAGG
jgi:hypothetical protein